VTILGLLAVRWFLKRRGKYCPWRASLSSGLNPKLLVDEELNTEEELDSAETNTDIISQGDQSKHAGFWGRVIAALIDGTILLIPGIIVGIVISPWLILPLVWIYGAVLESGQNQATFGKITMGFMSQTFMADVSASVGHCFAG
jgi:hypothetical protein